MPHRYETPGDARFLTFSCHDRLALFEDGQIKDLFVERLHEVRNETGLKAFAWVVMPEHVHLVVLPRLPGWPIAKTMARLKRPFARTVLARWRQVEAPILRRLVDSRGVPCFWLRGGGYDRNIRSPDDLIEKIKYVEENPVRRGLEHRCDEWKWSSAWARLHPEEGMTPDSP